MKNFNIYGIFENKQDLLNKERVDHIGHTTEVILPSNADISKSLFSTKENFYLIEVFIKNKPYAIKIIKVEIDEWNNRMELIGLLKTSEIFELISNYSSNRVIISAW